MAYLWCSTCGCDKNKLFNDSTMENDESVVLTEGNITNGNYICDKCNKDIDVGDKAMLCEFLPSGYYSSDVLIKSYFNTINIKQIIYK